MAEYGPRWLLQLLGGFELTSLPSGERVILPGKRGRVALAFLALIPNGRAARRKLTTLLWGDPSDETALENLRVCIWGMRKALCDEKHQVVASDGKDVVLDASAFEVDVLTLRRLLTESEPSALEQASKLYTGEFLDGLGIESDEFEAWRREEV